MAVVSWRLATLAAFVLVVFAGYASGHTPQEAHDPSHYGTLRQSLDLPANLQFDLGFRHVGQIVNQAVPAYGELDGRLGWQPTPTLELSIAGQNLLHRQHAEFGALATRKEVERGVSGKLVWRF